MSAIEINQDHAIDSSTKTYDVGNNSVELTPPREFITGSKVLPNQNGNGARNENLQQKPQPSTLTCLDHNRFSKNLQKFFGLTNRSPHSERDQQYHKELAGMKAGFWKRQDQSDYSYNVGIKDDWEALNVKWNFPSSPGTPKRDRVSFRWLDNAEEPNVQNYADAEFRRQLLLLLEFRSIMLHRMKAGKNAKQYFKNELFKTEICRG